MSARLSKDVTHRLLPESLTVGYLALVVFAANSLQLAYVLFPELAALTSDVLQRPDGKWAKEPWKLVATPAAAAIVGTVVAKELPYGVVAILLATCAALCIIRLLRSNVSPAISAGVLPIVLGVKSWLYPLCILGDLTCLALVLMLWRRMFMVRTL